MKYLKAFARICLHHSEKDCDGCPFAYENTKNASCLRYVAENPEEAQQKIIAYVKAVKEERERNRQ